MALDKELYRRAYELHRQWNEAELIERLHQAKERSRDEGWRQYIELWEFAWNVQLKPSHRQSLQKIKDLDVYYSRIRQFEAWRRARGRSS